jgi:rhodanese-related sulfurtransferase
MNSRALFLLMVIVLLYALSPVGVAAQTGSNDKPTAESQPADVPSTTAEELKPKVSKNLGVTIIDVRSSEAYGNATRKIKGAIHVKLRRLRYRLDFEPLKSVSRESEVVTYCACPNDEASIAAAKILMDAGFKRVRFLKGGWREWQRLGGPVEVVPKT